MTKVTDIAGTRLRPLSEHLFAFADTCNVYLVTDGDVGLVIDAGSGAVADHVADAGVGSLEWVLHTTITAINAGARPDSSPSTEPESPSRARAIPVRFGPRALADQADLR